MKESRDLNRILVSALLIWIVLLPACGGQEEQAASGDGQSATLAMRLVLPASAYKAQAGEVRTQQAGVPDIVYLLLSAYYADESGKPITLSPPPEKDVKINYPCYEVPLQDRKGSLGPLTLVDFTEDADVKFVVAVYDGDGNLLYVPKFEIKLQIRFGVRNIITAELEEPSGCVDIDKDGYGAGQGCDGPNDCDVYDPRIHPGATEICDGDDNNCDGSEDEGLTQPTTCGVGQCAGNTGFETCENGEWVDDTCDPLEGATEENCSDELDNDCDGFTDLGDPECDFIVYFPDLTLDTVVRGGLGISVEDDIWASQLRTLTFLSAQGEPIEDLTGLEHCTNLQELDLGTYCDEGEEDLSKISVRCQA